MADMIEIGAHARKWGRSVGVVLPKDAAKKEGIRPGDKLRVLVQKEKKNPLLELWGVDKSLRPAREILKEMDAEAWDE